jgi:dihydrofolate reductase
MTALPLLLVAAVAENGVIGRDNGLAWRLRSDLKRFRALTWGKPMIMGRKTFVSIGRPLPGRESIVLTRDPGFLAEGAHRAGSLAEAIETAERLAVRMGADAVAVAGGAEIYAQALPRADRLHLTLVHAAPDGDVRFPAFDRVDYVETLREPHPAGEGDEHAFTFLDLQRRRPAASR